MKREEWDALSYMSFGQWWDAPQTEDRRNAWFPMLSMFSAQEVQEALGRLLRTSKTFAPKLGELIAELEPPAPSFDEIWENVLKILGRVSPTYRGEDQAVAAIQQECGPEVAGWVALYGAKRMSLLEVHGEHGPIEVARLKKSYSEQMADPRQRERGAGAVKALMLGKGVQNEIEGGTGAV